MPTTTTTTTQPTTTTTLYLGDMNHNPRPFYWDASAVLSVLFKDAFTDDAQTGAQEKRSHFMSTMAYSKTCSVIARMQRENRPFRHLDKGIP
jgi:hypothetical protein